jgi:tricarballylate dehydrogenase
VIMKGAQPASNIFAAGEIMSGNILPKGYIGGFGLVIGNVFGRAAGSAAAAIARSMRKAA